LLELFAPLFKVFAGKRQVLQPHCIEASGLNDVNLFSDGQGRYLAPLTSRTCFLTRGNYETETVDVTISLPDASQLTWAQAIPLGDKPYQAAIRSHGGKAIVEVPNHGAATMLVVGKGAPPALERSAAARLLAVRAARFPRRANAPAEAASIPTGAATKATLSIDGTCFYHPGPFTVQLDDTAVGTLGGNSGTFPCTIADFAKPVVRIIAGDDGVWYLPERIRLTPHAAGKTTPDATWTSGEPIQAGRSPREIVLPLRWTRQSSETAR
jgi:hypothetical protein